MLPEGTAPQFQDLPGQRETAATLTPTAEGHFSLADQRVGEGLLVARAEGLEAYSARVCGAVPTIGGYLGGFDPLALDDGHLPPRAIEPDIPRDVAGGAAGGAIALERVEAVIEWIIHLALDEAAADPEAAGPIVQGAGVDATGDLLSFHAGLPGFAGVGDDELAADDEAVHLQFLAPAGQGREERLHGHRGDHGKNDGHQAIGHGRFLQEGVAGSQSSRTK